MKRITITICTACIILWSCNDSKTDDTTATTNSDSTKTSTDTSTAMTTPPMDSAAMMKAWQAYMTPGDVHKMFAKSNGTWDEEVTTWMDPSKPPIKSKSRAVNKMILGGRYQQSTHTGNMMGMPFEGMSTLGFDNAKKVLISSWIDNMGTGIMTMEGTWDSTTHTANLKGKMVEPTTGKDIDVRETFTMIDDKNQKLEMFATQGGKEMKTMEIIFKRK